MRIIRSIPPTTFYNMYVHARTCMYVWSYMFTFLLDLDMIYVRIQFPIPIPMNNNTDISTLVFATKRQWIGTITVRRQRHSVIIVSRRRRRLVMINGLIKCINQNRTTATDLEYGLGTCAPSVTAMSLAEFLISISKCSTSCHMSTHTHTYTRTHKAQC